MPSHLKPLLAAAAATSTVPLLPWMLLVLATTQPCELCILLSIAALHVCKRCSSSQVHWAEECVAAAAFHVSVASLTAQDSLEALRVHSSR